MMITMVLCWLLAAESRLRCSIHQFTISAIKTEFSLLIYVLGLCMSIEVLYIVGVPPFVCARRLSN